jgi:hypothetical protein
VANSIEQKVGIDELQGFLEDKISRGDLQVKFVV